VDVPGIPAIVGEDRIARRPPPRSKGSVRMSLPDPLVVGREGELARLGRLQRDRLHRGVVVTGAAGIGRTTVWDAGLAMAGRRGPRVLAARPAEGEPKRSFAALIDLCDGVGRGALAGLPRPQRCALEVALLRVETTGESLGPSAVSVAFVSLLRELAVESPLHIAIDDVQWLDAPSAQALVQAARRLEHEPIGFLLTRSGAAQSDLDRLLAQRGAERIALGPLKAEALRRLLRGRHGLTLRRHLLHQVVDVTQGNPSLALGMGRLLVEQGLPAFGADLPVPDAIEDVSGTSVAQLSDAACRLLLAVALNADLLRSELSAIETPGAIEDAVSAGLLRLGGACARGASAARPRRQAALEPERATCAPQRARGRGGRP
jgi:hypothetical protein